MTCVERHFAIACELRAVDLAKALQAAINQSPHWRNNARELLRQIKAWEATPTMVASGIERTLVP